MQRELDARVLKEEKSGEIEKLRVKAKQSLYSHGEALSVQEVEAPRLHDNRHMKAVRMSVLLTGRFYSPGNIPGTHFC